MDTKELLQTITAIKVALESGLNYKASEMKNAIHAGLWLCENTLNKAQVKDEVHEVETFDDLNPNYIKASAEEI